MTRLCGTVVGRKTVCPTLEGVADVVGGRDAVRGEEGRCEMSPSSLMKRYCLLTLFVIMLVGMNILAYRPVQAFASPTSTGEAGLSLIKEFEGLRLTAYKAVSSEEYYTIGYGHYGPDVTPGMTITEEQAHAYLVEDVKEAEQAINTFLSKNGIEIGQNQYDALISFTYNCGNVWKNRVFQLKTILINGYGNYSEDQIRTAFTNWNTPEQSARLLYAAILGNDAPTDFQVSWWADVIASDGAASAAAQMCESAAFEAVCAEFGLGGPAASVLRELAVVYDVSALPESDE